MKILDPKAHIYSNSPPARRTPSYPYIAAPEGEHRALDRAQVSVFVQFLFSYSEVDVGTLRWIFSTLPVILHIEEALAKSKSPIMSL